MTLRNKLLQTILLLFVCSSFISASGRLSFIKGHPKTTNHGSVVHMSGAHDEAEQAWGYVTVRPKANIFFWLYYTTHASGYRNRPLILWLQGGPGGSGTGFGNFEEIGPLDVNQNPRNTTWLQTASLLFIDSPVGTGYSYAEDDSVFATDDLQISRDLVAVMKQFVKNYPDFSDIPFYIFSESYGGKMTADFSALLYDTIHAGEIQMNFKGFAMGDSWISPVDSTNSWGPYLYSTSIVDLTGLNKINAAAKKVEDLVNEGKYTEATSAWSAAESVVESVSGGVNFYNILDWGDSESRIRNGASDSRSYLEKLYDRHVKVMAGDALDDLMNGPIKKKLGIPKNVIWGGQSGTVFEKLSGDFMKNVTAQVNRLINDSPLKVVVYSGQLDLICDVLGTEQWFYTLDIADKFRAASRRLVSCDGNPCYYLQEVGTVQFYWILKAGHMVPTDNGSAGLAMVNRIIE